MPKTPPSPDQMFQNAQKPVMWFSSAERLRSAAEIILADQVKQEVPYFRAVDAAGIEAELRAQNAPARSATVDIPCQPPNYRPAQLLYAFAIENAFKGLIVARNPNWISPRLSKRIKSHDLVTLAEDAGFSVAAEEVPILKALSRIGEWSGRYPVATAPNKYVNSENPALSLGDEPLDWGSQHPIMRACCDRALRELGKTLPEPPIRFGVVVAFAP